MDSVSEIRLNFVHPALSRRVHQLNSLLIDEDIYIHVIQGLRTFVQQDALYAQGRTTPGRIVTDARGGYSAHNFGYACDLDPFKLGVPDWAADDPEWQAMLSKALTCGLSEGALWREFPDRPHFYLSELPPTPTDQMRAAYNTGGLPLVWSQFTIE